MNAELQASTTCQTCGQVFNYEPIMVFGKDLAISIHKTCEDCAEREKRAAKIHEEAKRKADIEADIRASIPPDLLDTNIRHRDFNTGLWSAMAKWQPNQESFWLGIIGQAGKCKTRCMSLLAAKTMRQGVRTVWTTANRLKDASADRNSRERATAANARELLSSCLHAPWLFIDDIGKNEWTPAFESQFFQILDHRKNHRLPLVYSSNASPQAFSQVLTPLNSSPIIGRLLDRTTILDLMPS